MIQILASIRFNGDIVPFPLPDLYKSFSVTFADFTCYIPGRQELRGVVKLVPMACHGDPLAGINNNYREDCRGFWGSWIPLSPQEAMLMGIRITATHGKRKLHGTLSWGPHYHRLTEDPTACVPGGKVESWTSQSANRY